MRREVVAAKKQLARRRKWSCLVEAEKRYLAEVRTSYVKAIKSAKERSWKDFLERYGVSGKSPANPWGTLHRQAAGKTKKKVSFGNLERDDGSWTTSWKESAELKAHVGRGWGIQRRVVETLYDTVCIPMIAYGGEERTKSMTKSHVRRHLNALHRVLLLTLTRGCTLASTVSLEVVAGRMPLDLAVCLRSLRQSIKAKRAIKLLGFTSDAEAPVADEMGRANEHVVFFWQESRDAEKRGRMTYRFLRVWALHP